MYEKLSNLCKERVPEDDDFALASTGNCNEFVPIDCRPVKWEKVFITWSVPCKEGPASFKNKRR